MDHAHPVQDEQHVTSLYDDAAVATTYLQMRFQHAWSRLLHQRQVAVINRVIRRYQPTTVLELAPGPARLATDIQGVRQGVMIESSAEMLAVARQRLRRAGLEGVWQFRQQNAFDLEAQPCPCDLLYTFRFLRHFRADERARLYRGIKACLKPGGLFMLDVVNHHVRQRLEATRSSEAEPTFDIYDVTYSRDEFHRELEAAGFTVLAMQPVLRAFALQSWLSYTGDHRAPIVTNLLVHLLEHLPSRHPLEWVAVAGFRPEAAPPGQPAEGEDA